MMKSSRLNLRTLWKEIIMSTNYSLHLLFSTIFHINFVVKTSKRMINSKKITRRVIHINMLLLAIGHHWGEIWSESWNKNSLNLFKFFSTGSLRFEIFHGTINHRITALHFGVKDYFKVPFGNLNNFRTLKRNHVLHTEVHTLLLKTLSWDWLFEHCHSIQIFYENIGRAEVIIWKTIRLNCVEETFDFFLILIIVRLNWWKQDMTLAFLALPIQVCIQVMLVGTEYPQTYA